MRDWGAKKILDEWEVLDLQVSHLIPLLQLFQARKFYIRRNNNKADSIETEHIVIAHLLP